MSKSGRKHVDLAETIHRASYGKSGRASANAGNKPFLAGYAAGRKEGETDDIFAREYARRGSPEYGKPLRDFREWKRGFWASRMQKIIAENPLG